MSDSTYDPAKKIEDSRRRQLKRYWSELKQRMEESILPAVETGSRKITAEEHGAVMDVIGGISHCVWYLTEELPSAGDAHAERAAREGITRDEAKLKSFVEAYSDPDGPHVLKASKLKEGK